MEHYHKFLYNFQYPVFKTEKEKIIFWVEQMERWNVNTEKHDIIFHTICSQKTK